MTNSTDRTKGAPGAPDLLAKSPVQTLASVVKDGLRTARYGGAKIARKLDEKILNAPPPAGVPAEIDAGVKSLGRMFLNSVDTLSRVERTLVDKLVPEHRPHVALGSPDLLRHLREEPAAFGVRSSFFARFTRHWLVTYLHAHGVVAELLPDSALEQAAGQFRETPVEERPADWAAELAGCLMRALPEFHALGGGGQKDGGPSASQAYLTLALAIAIAQSAELSGIADERCWDMARNLVVVEADSLQVNAQDKARLAGELERIARLA